MIPVDYLRDFLSGRKPGRQFAAGDYRALLLNDRPPESLYWYLYLLPVFELATQALRLCVSAERNRLAGLGAGSHFLCLFDDSGHSNFGPSDRWMDAEAFTEKALRIAHKKLQLSQDWREEPVASEWWEAWQRRLPE